MHGFGVVASVSSHKLKFWHNILKIGTQKTIKIACSFVCLVLMALSAHIGYIMS